MICDRKIRRGGVLGTIQLENACVFTLCACKAVHVNVHTNFYSRACLQSCQCERAQYRECRNVRAWLASPLSGRAEKDVCSCEKGVFSSLKKPGAGARRVARQGGTKAALESNGELHSP